DPAHLARAGLGREVMAQQFGAGRRTWPPWYGFRAAMAIAVPVSIAAALTTRVKRPGERPRVWSIPSGIDVGSGGIGQSRRFYRFLRYPRAGRAAPASNGRHDSSRRRRSRMGFAILSHGVPTITEFEALMIRRIIPLIMCGGAGTRLWPASREVHPKQFLSLFGARSTFQDTLLRVSDTTLFERPVVITNNAYRFMVLEQLA